MKTAKFLGILISSVIIFSSCNDRDDKVPDSYEVIFTSGINQAQTRVGGSMGNEWEGNEHIGIYMVDYSHPDVILDDAENVRYTATRAGATTSFTSTTPIYFPPSEFVNFIAYHPYSDQVVNKVYPINILNQTNQSAIDLMVAPLFGNGYNVSINRQVNLEFTHQLVKLELSFISSDIPNLSTGISSVKIKGMNTIADFDIFRKTISNEDKQLDIDMKGNGTHFEAIVLPCNLSGKSVEIVVDGNTYVWNMPNNQAGNSPVTVLEGGWRYSFIISINKIAVPVSGTITGWKGIQVQGNAETCQVGDYYYADGSWSKYLSTSKICVGIVYQTNGAHGKVVNLNESTQAWGTPMATNAVSPDNGKHNMSAIRALYPTIPPYTEFPAFKYCADLGDNWYLPAKDELTALYQAYNNYGKAGFNNRLISAGGKDFGGEEYWSSTEIVSLTTSAWSVRFGSDGSLNDGPKSTTKRIRAILAF